MEICNNFFTRKTIYVFLSKNLCLLFLFCRLFMPNFRLEKWLLFRELFAGMRYIFCKDTYYEKYFHLEVQIWCNAYDFHGHDRVSMILIQRKYQTCYAWYQKRSQNHCNLTSKELWILFVFMRTFYHLVFT